MSCKYSPLRSNLDEKNLDESSLFPVEGAGSVKICSFFYIDMSKTLRTSEFLLDWSLIKLIFHVRTYSKILSLSNFIHSNYLSRTIETLVFIFSGKICSQFYIWFYIRRKKTFGNFFVLFFFFCLSSPGVNFTNILQAAFSYESFCAQLFCTYITGLYLFDPRFSKQKLVLKCWWNWHQ